jgi:hypothetical protein
MSFEHRETSSEAFVDEFDLESSTISFQEFFQKTGIGIKLRFLAAVFFIAFLPVFFFALFFSRAALQLFGRNTWLVLSGILLLTVLVATSVALPIIRPIRRATRDINDTLEKVNKLTINARHITQEHRIGTSILSGASRRLQGRRHSIIRDGTFIVQTCTVLQPRLTFLMQKAQASRDKQSIELLAALQQGIKQIATLADTMASSFERDTSLEQLDKAMSSAQEISAQFEDASRQLEGGAYQLEQAAESLI